MAEPVRKARVLGDSKDELALVGVVTRINAVIHKIQIYYTPQPAAEFALFIYARAERRKYYRFFEIAHNFPVQPLLCEKLDKYAQLPPVCDVCHEKHPLANTFLHHDSKEEIKLISNV